MRSDNDALAGFDEYFGRILAALQPAARRRATMKLGRALLRANLARIAANEEPDGSAMEPRKPRLDRRGRLRRRSRGKMFRKLRKRRNFRIDAQPDSVEIGLRGGRFENIAAEHHFGLEGTVGKGPDRRTIRHRYAERRLLGFGPRDHEEVLEIAEEMLGLDR